MVIRITQAEAKLMLERLIGTEFPNRTWTLKNSYMSYGDLEFVDTSEQASVAEVAPPYAPYPPEPVEMPAAAPTFKDIEGNSIDVVDSPL